MKIKYYILAFIFLSGCLVRPSLNAPLKLHEKIEGNWMSYGSNKDNSRTFISFNFSDDNCFAVWILNSNFSYQIIDRELILYDLSLKEEGNRKHRFKIEKITSNELVLKPITDNAKTMLSRYEKGFEERIKFVKILKKNDIEFDIISFKSSDCYGNCASFQFEINKDRKVVFYGRKNISNVGFYKGNITQREIDEIRGLIQKIDWEDSGGSKAAEIIDDDQSFLLKLKVGNQLYSKKVYRSSDKMTAELSILINKLLEFQYLDSLKKVNWENNGFQLEEVPPPPKEKK